MAQVKFKRGTKQEINVMPIVDGQLIYNTDAGNYYMDIGGKRISEKDYVTPEMFGAKGDGVTDDTKAVQDAIADAEAKNVSVKGFRKYLIKIPLVTKTDLYLREIKFTGIGFAITVRDTSGIEIAVDRLTTSDSGIEILSDKVMVNHDTIRVRDVIAKNCGLSFRALTKGTQYCNVYIDGMVRGDTDAAVKMTAEQTGSWVGEIKFFGGELRSAAGWGLFTKSPGDRDSGITAIRFIACSFEQALKGICLDNVFHSDFVACRRESAGSIVLKNYCYDIRFSGYITNIDKIELTGFNIYKGGVEPGIRFIGQAFGKGVGNAKDAYVAYSKKVYFTPNENFGYAEGAEGSSAEAPVEIVNKNSPLTFFYARSNEHLKLTKYHDFFGINSVEFYAPPNVSLYKYDNTLIGKTDKSGFYRIFAYNDYNGWAMVYLGSEKYGT